ncbi:MAG: hypothetical protein JXJ17_08555 [Anaerolineae bacterium]|nr:hypothetical protein [Anaerolineae bacterium]
MLTEDEITDFETGLGSLTSQPGFLRFLLYCIRPNQSADIPPPDLSDWNPRTTTVNYNLGGKPAQWPVVLQLYEIESPSLPDQLEARFQSLLEHMVLHGAVLSWFMFEGAFGDISNLFTEWTVPLTYGICYEGFGPIVAVSYKGRQEKSWCEYLFDANSILYTKYPELRMIKKD